VSRPPLLKLIQKRKAVVPKKGAEPEHESSPSGPRSGAMSNEDASRLMEMENRVMGLEDRLANALDEVQEARSREIGLMMVMREVLGHLASVDKGTSARYKTPLTPQK